MSFSNNKEMGAGGRVLFLTILEQTGDAFKVRMRAVAQQFKDNGFASCHGCIPALHLLMATERRWRGWK